MSRASLLDEVLVKTETENNFHQLSALGCWEPTAISGCMTVKVIASVDRLGIRRA